MFGTLGDRFVTAAIAISTFGFLDLAILAPTRVYYAMAADRVFLPALSRLHPTLPDAVDRDPHPVDVVVRAGADRTLRAVAQLRRVRGLDLLRPDGRDGHDLPPHVSAVTTSARDVPCARVSGRARSPSCVVAAAVVLSVVRADPASAWRGALLLAAGVPVFYWFTRRG